MENHPTKNYEVIQVNLQRKKLATDELIMEAGRRKTSFALVSEPYIGASGVLKQPNGTRVIQRSLNREKPNKAAIIVFDPDIEIIEHPLLTSENIVVATLKTNTWTMVIISIYLEEEKAIDQDIGAIKHICEAIEVSKVLIGGDANAWSSWWGSVSENHRGEALAGAFVELDMEVLNEGSEPTFFTIRGDKTYQSRVDVTACKTSMLGIVDNWRVEKGITSSDHNAIVFTIRMRTPTEARKSNSTRIYNTKKANWSEFRTEMAKNLNESGIDIEYIKHICSINTLEEATNKYIDSIKKACEKAIPIIKRKSKINLPWWSEELTKLKKEMVTKKRRISHAAPRRRCHVVSEYLKAKERYELSAKEAQTLSWKQFCETQDKESMWDGVYRVIRNTARRYEDQPLVRGGRVLSPEESAKHLSDTFFPDDKSSDDDANHERVRQLAESIGEKVPNDTEDPLFTEAELERAIRSFNPKKAPGSDGFTADICAAAIRESSGTFLALLNRCLELAHFPTRWKEATVVVLRKPGKDDYSQAKSYRPIGLLSVLGKVLEKMMIKRVRWHLLPKANPRQYGFVPQRCTEDALYDLIQHFRDNMRRKLITVVVSLDIEGAFDNAWWPAVKCRLVEKGCPHNLRSLINSYLTDRAVTVGYAGREYSKPTTKGCIQGSIGGPTFWNILLDPLLDELDRQGIYCQAFADDIVLVFSGLSVPHIERIGDRILALVDAWGIQNKLKFAAHKTQAMIITNKIKYDTPCIHMAGTVIQMKEDIKILGLIIDRKLTFHKHVSHVCQKATNIYKQLCRAAKISWGLNPEIIRTMYVAVVEPIIMYAASAWAGETNKISIQKQLNAVQRGFAQKIIRSYRTVSLNSALVLSGLLPLDMRVREAAQLYEAKRGKPQETLHGREVEKRVCSLEALHPAKAVEVEFVCLEDMQPQTLADHKIRGTRIFTDGSKIEGKVGAAMSYWRDDSETLSGKYKLESYCTVFQAEMFALLKATETALAKKDQEINIFSDSRSSLELLKDPDSLHPIAFEIKNNIRKLNSRGQTLRFFWIRAHVGNEGNERADALAKEAALHKKTAPEYDRCPISYIKRNIREETRIQWEQRYTTSDTASTTKLFFPNIDSAYKSLKKLKLNPTLVQALTGHGGFGAYLHKFKCKDTPACVCDPDVDETIEHLIVDCPKYGYERLKTEILLDTQICKSNFSEIMDSDKCKIFVQFIEMVVRDSRRRNKSRDSGG